MGKSISQSAPKRNKKSNICLYFFKTFVPQHNKIKKQPSAGLLCLLSILSLLIIRNLPAVNKQKIPHLKSLIRNLFSKLSALNKLISYDHEKLLIRSINKVKLLICILDTV